MTLEEAFITNLVCDKIPMINEWITSMKLEIEQNLQLENYKNTDASIKFNSGFSGYSLGENLNRGYLQHNPNSIEYSSETHYLLGMYLRALKQLKNLDALHLYNCVISSKQENTRHIYSAPIILNRVYSIYVSSILPIKVYLYNSALNEKLNIPESTINIKISNSASTLIALTKDFETASQIDTVFKVDDTTFNNNLEEFLELRIETPVELEVAVIEGNYSLSGSQIRVPVNDTSSKVILKNNSLYTGAFYSKYSPKLIEFLLNTAVTEDSNSEIKKAALKLYPEKSISAAAKKYLVEKKFKYDIDDFIDKRLPI